MNDELRWLSTCWFVGPVSSELQTEAGCSVHTDWPALAALDVAPGVCVEQRRPGEKTSGC